MISELAGEAFRMKDYDASSYLSTLVAQSKPVQRINGVRVRKGVGSVEAPLEQDGNAVFLYKAVKEQDLPPMRIWGIDPGMGGRGGSTQIQFGRAIEGVYADFDCGKQFFSPTLEGTFRYSLIIAKKFDSNRP